MLVAKAGAGLCGHQTCLPPFVNTQQHPLQANEGALLGASKPSGDISAQRHALQELCKAQGGHLWH